MTCKLPDVGGIDFRSRNWPRTNIINYADADPTSPLGTAGRYWVGTAPSNMYKSLNTTSYGETKKAEFQIRSMGSDGRSRMLSSMKPGHKPEPEVLQVRVSRVSSVSFHSTAPLYKGAFTELFSSFGIIVVTRVCASFCNPSLSRPFSPLTASVVTTRVAR